MLRRAPLAILLSWTCACTIEPIGPEHFRRDVQVDAGTEEDGGPVDGDTDVDSGPSDGGRVDGDLDGGAVDGARDGGVGDADAELFPDASPDAEVLDIGSADAGFNCPDAGTATVTPTIVNGYARIAAGCFIMGARPGTARRSDEEPQHEVAITRDFWLKTTEVTEQEWLWSVGQRPSNPSCLSCPATNVGWYDAAYFCNRWSQDEGRPPCYTLTGCTGTAGLDLNCSSLTFVGIDCLGYRLPTEAEWEYATRAGTSTEFWSGDMTVGGCNEPVLDPVGWYCHPNVKTPAQKLRNPWGLWDVHGNVWEWVHDRWANDYYSNSPRADPTGASSGGLWVIRGGSFVNSAEDCRSSARDSFPADSWVNNIGFRTARTAP